MIHCLPAGLRPHRVFLAFLAFLLAVRLAVVLAGYPIARGYKPAWAWSNNDGYDAIALNWVATGVYGLQPGIPTAARLPLYPALIALVGMAAGAAWVVGVMLVQALLSVLTGGVLFRLADRLVGRRAAVVTGALFILHPQVNNFVFRCATETLYLAVIVLLLYHLVRLGQTGSDRHRFIAGFWLSLSLLVRPTLAPLAWLAIPVLALAGGAATLCRRLARVLLLVALVAAVLGPWLIRNHAQSGSWTVLQTWVGQPLYQGLYVSRRLPEFLRCEKSLSDLDAEALADITERVNASLALRPVPDRRPVALEVAADRAARALAVRQLLDQPLTSLARWARNLVLAPVLQMTWSSTWILVLWNGPLLLLSLLGAIRCFRVRRRAWLEALPVTILFLYFLASHALWWPQARYVLPALIPFSLFAAYGLTALRPYGGTGRRPRSDWR